MKRIKHFIKTRKILSIVILLVLAGIGYWVYSKFTSTSGETSYIVSNVKRGNIAKTISGTGQVEASSQLSLTSKVSGDVVYINSALNGTQIKKGTLIAQIDTHDAEVALKTAQIAYDKLVKPATELEIFQAENAVADAIRSNEKSYDDAFNTISGVFADLPEIMVGLNDIIYSNSGYLENEKVRAEGQIALDYRTKAADSFDKAKISYENILDVYKGVSRISGSSTIESFTAQTYNVVKNISEATKNIQNTIDYVRVQRDDTITSTPAGTVSAWATTINTDLTSLLSAKNTILTTRQDIVEKKASLIDLKDGADALDIASQKLTLQEKQYDYENYFIRAPFDGLLAKLSVKSTDTVGNGTTIATIVSANKMTTISLNEVDTVNVKVGQRAKITFDAIEGLTLEGTVTSVDQVGTVSQGVVSYDAEITFNTQDERIKSGMSTSAEIIVDTKENVLTVPNSAIKTQGNGSYVEVFTTPLMVVRGSTTGTPSAVLPTKKMVEVGISNDTETEIISGLEEGDQIVTRTIAGTTVAKTTSSSILTGGNRTNTGSATRALRN